MENIIKPKEALALAETLEGRDSEYAKKFILNRDFESLRDLVESILVKLEAKMSKEDQITEPFLADTRKSVRLMQLLEYANYYIIESDEDEEF